MEVGATEKASLPIQFNSGIYESEKGPMATAREWYPNMVIKEDPETGQLIACSEKQNFAIIPAEEE